MSEKAEKSISAIPLSSINQVERYSQTTEAVQNRVEERGRKIANLSIAILEDFEANIEKTRWDKVVKFFLRDVNSFVPGLNYTKPKAKNPELEKIRPSDKQVIEGVCKRCEDNEALIKKIAKRESPENIFKMVTKGTPPTKKPELEADPRFLVLRVSKEDVEILKKDGYMGVVAITSLDLDGSKVPLMLLTESSNQAEAQHKKLEFIHILQRYVVDELKIGDSLKMDEITDDILYAGKDYGDSNTYSLREDGTVGAFAKLYSSESGFFNREMNESNSELTEQEKSLIKRDLEESFEKNIKGISYRIAQEVSQYALILGKINQETKEEVDIETIREILVNGYADKQFIGLIDKRIKSFIKLMDITEDNVNGEDWVSEAKFETPERYQAVKKTIEKYYTQIKAEKVDNLVKPMIYKYLDFVEQKLSSGWSKEEIAMYLNFNLIF